MVVLYPSFVRRLGLFRKSDAKKCKFLLIDRFAFLRVLYLYLDLGRTGRRKVAADTPKFDDWITLIIKVWRGRRKRDQLCTVYNELMHSRPD